MSDKHFALVTRDPTFDPEKPITVNGHLFVPARRGLVERRPAHPKVMVEMARRKLVTPR